MLQTNDTLTVLDVSNNPMDDECAKLIYESVFLYNESIKSFGDLSQNLMMGVRVKEEIAQCLKVNSQSKEKQIAGIISNT